MGNDTEKNQQNPEPGNTADFNKKNPSQTGEDVHNPQDNNRKNPGQESAPDRKDREGSDDVEKRRAS